MAELTRIRAVSASSVSALAKHWPILIPYALFLVAVHAWFSTGSITGEDFRQFGWLSMPVFDRSVPWPSAWDPTFGFGLSLQLWLETFPLMAAGGLLAHAGLGWNVIERVLIFFPLFVCIVASPYALFLRAFRSPAVAALGALLFCLNTYTISLIQRGHVPAVLAYALIPLGLLVIVSSLERPSWRLGVVYAVVLEAQFMLELRYTYLSLLCAVIIGVVWLIAMRRAFITRERVEFIAAVFLTFIGLNLYWILPTLLFKPRVPGGFSDLQAFVNATKDESLIDAFANFHPYYHHVLSSDDFAMTPVEPGFIVMSLFAVAGYIADRTRLLTRALFVIWVFAVIFVTGAIWPFVQLNEWVFQHVPGMFLFRESAKVMSLTSLCVAYGVAAMVFQAARVEWLSTARKYAIPVASALVAIFCVWLMRDAYDPLRFSNFTTYPAFKADRALRDYLGTSVPGRVLYFPDTPLGVGPTVRNGAVSAVYAFTWKYPPEGMANFAPDLGSMYGALDSALAPDLLCELGVRYIVVDPDPFSALYQPWYFKVTRGEAIRYFDTRPWLKAVAFSQDGIPARNRYVVYHLNDCAQLPVEAFVTQSSIAFNGNETALQALAGTPLWSRRGAALFSADLLPPQFAAVSAAISGEVFYDQYALQRAAESTGRRIPRFQGDMAANSAVARGVHLALTGFSIDRDAETRILGYRNPIGMNAVFIVSQPGEYRVFHRSIPRVAGRGVIWQRDLRGAALSRIHIAIPLAEHPMIDIGIATRGRRAVTLSYVVRGPDGTLTASAAGGPEDAIISDAYATVQAAILDKRDARIHRDAAEVYSHPVRDAADYTIERIEVHPAVAARYAAISIPQTVLAAPIIDTFHVREPSDVPLAVHLSAGQTTTVTYRVPLVQPDGATAVSLDFSAQRLPELQLSLNVRDGRTGANTIVPVALNRLSDCYACLVETLATPRQTPLGVPAYSGAAAPVSPNLVRIVLPLAHVLAEFAPRASGPRVTGLVLRATWGGVRRTRTIRTTLEHVRFRRWLWSDAARSFPNGAVILVDGKPVSGQLRLASGRHTLVTLAGGARDIDSVVLVHGRLPSTQTAVLKPLSEGASEIVGSVRSGAGLFVFPQTYMYGWRLAILPKGLHVTGNPYVDAFRLMQFMLPENSHRIVNGNLNGWMVPNLDGRVVLLFMPTVVSAYGAAATLLLILAFLAAFTVWRRRA